VPAAEHYTSGAYSSAVRCTSVVHYLAEHYTSGAYTAASVPPRCITDGVARQPRPGPAQGEHGGNLFSLLLRHVDADPAAVRRAVRAVRRRGFINYFGHQRCVT
jgi:hypothetical protein